MSDAILRAKLDALRDGFDLSFSEPLPVRADAPEDLLAIEIAGHAYALRARELHGLYVDRAIMPVPDAPQDLLGVAAVRGELVAVYDLAALLGYPRGTSPRFLALGNAALAFAFGTLHGHVRPNKTEIHPTDGAREPWFAEVLREPNQTRPILELSAISSSIELRLRSTVPKENLE